METDRVERKLSAILAADVAGYSRLMGVDEEGTLRRLNGHRREHFDPCIAKHRGRIVKTTGRRAAGRVRQRRRCGALRRRGAGRHGRAQCRRCRRPAARIPHRHQCRRHRRAGRRHFRRRRQHRRAAGRDRRARRHLRLGSACRRMPPERSALTFEDIGEQALKNIARPIRAYRLRPDGDDAARPHRVRHGACPTSRRSPCCRSRT